VSVPPNVHASLAGVVDKRSLCTEIRTPEMIVRMERQISFFCGRPERSSNARTMSRVRKGQVARMYCPMESEVIQAE